MDKKKKKKYELCSPQDHCKMPEFPAFVTVTDTVAFEETIMRDGSKRRRVIIKRERHAEGIPPKGLPWK